MKPIDRLAKLCRMVEENQGWGMPSTKGTTLGEDQDSLMTPHASYEVKGDTLQLWSDEGDESRYGEEIWELGEGGGAVLISGWGRDTHEGGLFDHIGFENPEFANSMQATRGGRTSNFSSMEIPMGEFQKYFKEWWDSWQKASQEVGPS